MTLALDLWRSFRSWARGKAESHRLREARQENERRRVAKQSELIDNLPIVPSGPRIAQDQLAPIVEGIRKADISNATKRMLIESLPIQPDWLTPWQDWLNTLQFDGWWPVITGLTGRKEGAFFPFFRSEMELQILRDISRAIYTTNNHARGMTRGLRSYTIRKGYKATIVDKDNKDPVLQAKAQRVLDRFIAKNRWYARQQEFFTRSVRDGEALLRIFAGESGDRIPAVRFVWPEQIKQPQGSTSDLTWSYGVHTDPNDIETVHGYAVHALDGSPNFEEVSAADIVHFKRNVDSGVKRGIPDFVWGMKDALEQAGKLERNLGHGSAIQSAIAYIIQYAFGTRGEIEQAAMDNEDYKEGRPYPTNNTRSVQQFEPGMIVHTSKNEQFVESPYSAGVAGHIEVVKLLLRSAQSLWNAPSWLGSSDASDMGAYTSSLVAESPFVMGVETEQDDYAAVFLKVLTRVIEYGIAAGLLPKDTLQKVEIKQEVLSPVARDRQVEATIAHTKLEDKTTSPQQVIRESGQKPEEIIREWKEWSKAPIHGQADIAPIAIEPSPGDDTPQADAITQGSGTDLRQTVGGLNAIAGLQSDYYAGKLPRPAAVANVMLLFGFSEGEASSLFPEIAPTKLQPDEVGQSSSQESQLDESDKPRVNRTIFMLPDGERVEKVEMLGVELTEAELNGKPNA